MRESMLDRVFSVTGVLVMAGKMEFDIDGKQVGLGEGDVEREGGSWGGVEMITRKLLNPIVVPTNQPLRFLLAKP
jgi:hypothetical protein